MDEHPEQHAKRRKLSHDKDQGDDLLAVFEVQSDRAGQDLALQADEIVTTNATVEADIETSTSPTTGTNVDEKGSSQIQTSSSGQTLSKNQLKKLRKKQEWEDGRDDRKAKRKAKDKEKKARKRERREREEQEQASGKTEGTDAPPDRRGKVHHPTLLPITFMIDCGFDDKMNDNERISLGSQVTRAYSDNHRTPFQAHLVVSSWGGHLKTRFDTILGKSHLNWRGVTFTESSFAEAAVQAEQVMKGSQGGKLAGIFQQYATLGKSSRASKNTTVENGKQEATEAPTHSLIDNSSHHAEDSTTAYATVLDAKSLSDDVIEKGAQNSSLDHLKNQGEIIYLTSDSPDTLSTLSPYSTYIIGGIVDKNRHKGICYKVARDAGIKTAKLPIGEFMEMNSRFVLATNHVVEIMIRYLECGDWGEAFMRVIPKRKGGKLRRDKESGENGDDATRREEKKKNFTNDDMTAAGTEGAIQLDSPVSSESGADEVESDEEKEE